MTPEFLVFSLFLLIEGSLIGFLVGLLLFSRQRPIQDLKREPPENVKRSWTVDQDYQKALLVEYEMTQRKIEHADTITWQRASIFAVANLAALSYAAVNMRDLPLPAFVLLGLWSSFVMLLWYLWDFRLQQEVKVKFARLQEIERQLGLKQHLMIKEVDDLGKRIGPRGTSLAVFLTLLVIGVWILAICAKFFTFG